jgi:2-dehydropantoate 2-reductase
VTDSRSRPWRVAVVGAGGIGCYMALLATEAGADVTLCARKPIEQVLVEHDGAVEAVPVRVATSATAVAPVDHVIVAVKIQDTPAIAGWLEALASRETVVAVAQNGVDQQERLGDVLPGSPVVPMLVYITVEPVAAGHVRHASGDRIVVPDDERGRRFARLLASSRARVNMEEDFVTALWRKLLGNAVANPLTTLTLRRADVLGDDDLQGLIATLIGEALAVGQAEGAQFAPDEAARLVADLQAIPPANGTSMLFDRLRSQPLEHESITGAIVSRGRRHGIPTPANDTLLALLRGLDAGIRNARANAS